MHGRDRLLQAFERSRLVAVDVMAELTPLGEPSEYVNLAPTTGPVPLMVPNQRPPEALPQEPEQSPIAVTVVEPDAEVEVEVEPAPAIDEPEATNEIDVPQVDSDDGIEQAPAVDDVDNTVLLMRDAHEVHDHDEDDAERKSAPVVALFGDDVDDDAESMDVASADGDPRGSVDDLFARLRASRADS